MNYILSYPRSGVTWFRYCIEQLTGYPTLGASKADLPICDRDGINLNVDPDKDYIAFKRHWWNEKEINQNDFLFLIIRNHVEILSRHYTKDNHEMSKILNEDAVEYVKNIKKFEQFQGDKYQLYYEDLIEDSSLKEILKDTKQILPVIDGRIKSFMNNIDYHRKKSLESYPKSHTKGEKKVYHQREVDDSQRRRFHERVKELLDDDLFETYLSYY